MTQVSSCFARCGSMAKVFGVAQSRGAARLAKFKYFHVIECAKGKKGGKKGGNKKGARSLIDIPKKQQAGEPWLATESITYLLLLVESYKRQVGKPLIEGIDIAQIADGIWKAPFALLSNDPDEEGKPYIYVNKGALQLMDCEWGDLVGQSSVDNNGEISEQQKLMEEVREKGQIVGNNLNWSNKKGVKLTIPEARLFNVSAPDGEVVGQAVVVQKWEYEDGSIGTVGAPPAKLPTYEDLQQAEEELTNMKNFIRDLKENQGKNNQDEEVQSAVASMMEQKKLVEKLQQLQQEQTDAK